MINNFFNEFIKIEKRVNEDGVTIIDINRIRKPYYLSQNFIKDFQCVVKRNNLKYDLISKDVIREIKKQLIKVISLKNSIPNSHLENLFILLLDLAFYSYSLNINSNTTFKLSQIIVLTCKFLSFKEDSIKHSIFSKIHKDTDFILRNYQRKSKSSSTNIDTINLLIAVKKIGNEYQFSSRRIKELFKLESENDYDNLNYFQIVSLLYYVENIFDYEDIKNNIELTVKKRYSDDNDPFSKSELTLLFFDFICCPFVTTQTKRSIIKSSKYADARESNANIDSLILEIGSNKKWFMDWDIDIDLEKVLKKKEWGLTY